MSTSPSDSSAGKTAFVAGATGYVGRQVVRRLCAAGVRTWAHVRASSADIETWRERFEAVGAETVVAPWAAESMQSLMSECSPTHVFCLIGTTRARAKLEKLQGDIYENVDYRLSKLLLDASLALSRPPRFVYLSVINASEESRSPYLRVRGKFERELKASGLSYLSAQPSIITGHDRDEDRTMERWGAVLADRALGLMSHLGGRELQQRYQSTSATRLATALVHLALGDQVGLVSGAGLREED